MIYTDDSDARVIRTALVRHFNLHTALFLTQLDYLLDHSVSIRDGYHWTYRTYQEWEDDLGLSRSTIQRIVRRLKAQGIVVCGCFNRFRYDRTTWFRLDYEVLRRMGLEIRHNCTGEKAIRATEQAELREKRAAQKAFTVPKRGETPSDEPEPLLTAEDVDDGFDFQNSTARFLVPELQQKVLRQHCGKKAGKV
jgi:DNA-binding Lrp family transcriptional regulator